ncbi:hypothetical protein VP01_4305g4 [Puccinia sorghi]|uniref:Uncharacterized protein n=1 Tax=Puccinia sorghi TaxID=27349 RepID=A0A0L6UQ46_9BASI|nr:hypothetical protein VP01_4305g4 [Puccinia sorghi]
MEKLQKELSELEAKVEAGFIQLYHWQDIDRQETKDLKAIISGKVADIDALKSKASQLVPSQSPTHIVQTQQFRQDLENLIGAKSQEVTKKLQDNIEEIKQKLCATESG